MKTKFGSTYSAFAAVLLLALPLSSAHAGAIHHADLFTTSLGRSDDGFTGPVSTGLNLNLYGSSLSSLYINNNGNVTLADDGLLWTYTPFNLGSATDVRANRAMLAPFFADVDTVNAGTDIVRYGAATIGGRSVFGVNWIDVGYYNSDYNAANKLNSFQLIITDRSDTGAGNFDFEFNYDTINWETGDADDGVNGLGGLSAMAGWTDGAGTYYQFLGSLTNGAFLDSNPNGLIYGSRLSDVAGQYIFQVRSGQVINEVPEPASIALLGLGLTALVGLRRRKS